MAERTVIVVTAIVYDDETGMTGFVEELVGVTAHGKNVREVMKRLRQGVQHYYEDHRESIAQRMEPTYLNVRRERFAVDVALPTPDYA